MMDHIHWTSLELGTVLKVLLTNTLNGIGCLVIERMAVLRESFTKKGISERSTCWENISSVVGL